MVKGKGRVLSPHSALVSVRRYHDGEYCVSLTFGWLTDNGHGRTSLQEITWHMSEPAALLKANRLLTEGMAALPH